MGCRTGCWGGGASGILLAGVLDGGNFDGGFSDAVHHDVIRMHHGFPSSRYAAGTIHIWVIGEAFCGAIKQIGHTFSRCSIAVGNIVDDGAIVLPGSGAPNDEQH